MAGWEPITATDGERRQVATFGPRVVPIGRPPTRALYDEWQHEISETFVPLESFPVDDRPFWGQLDGAQVGGLSLIEASSVAQSVVRSQRTIRRAPGEMYKVSLQISGQAVLEQDDREAVLRPGDFAFYDTNRPYRMKFSDEFALTVLMFPRELLSLPVGVTTNLTARALPSGKGAGALLAAYLRNLRAHAAEYDVHTAEQLGKVGIDLLITALGELGFETGTTPGEALMLRILTWIRQHLADDDLSPARIADAHGISVRYLYRLFSDEGSTVAAYVRTQRLDRIHADLRNPLFGRRSIASIAARWGMPDQPHLTRVFREEFQMTPGEVRRQAGIGPGCRR